MIFRPNNLVLERWPDKYANMLTEFYKTTRFSDRKHIRTGLIFRKLISNKGSDSDHQNLKSLHKVKRHSNVERNELAPHGYLHMVIFLVDPVSFGSVINSGQ